MPYIDDIRRTTIVRDRYVPEDTVNDNVQLVQDQTRNIPATIVSYVLSILEILLAFRLVFRMMGASTGSGFVSGIYALTAPLVAPFAGIFPNDSLAGATLEWSTIIAMVAFALIGGLLLSLLNRASRPYATTA